MGKFSNGIFGNFYGKIGNVVGSSWRGIDYLRSLPKFDKNRQPSAKQLEQQARFALMTGFLNPIRDVLDIGYQNYAKGVTAYNSALSANIINAISGTYPAIALDYSMVQLSRGIMPGGQAPAVAAAAGATANFSWIDNTGKGKSMATDKTIALVYCPELNEAEFSIGTASRADEALSLQLPIEFVGKAVETYVFWVSLTGKEVTSTVYTGQLTVLN